MAVPKAKILPKLAINPDKLALFLKMGQGIAAKKTLPVKAPEPPVENENFGFSNLHHTCGEDIGNLEIYIRNKKRLPGSVRVRTVDGGA